MHKGKHEFKKHLEGWRGGNSLPNQFNSINTSSLHQMGVSNANFKLGIAAKETLET